MVAGRELMEFGHPFDQAPSVAAPHCSLSQTLNQHFIAASYLWRGLPTLIYIVSLPIFAPTATADAKKLELEANEDGEEIC